MSRLTPCTIIIWAMPIAANANATRKEKKLRYASNILQIHIMAETSPAVEQDCTRNGG